MSVLDWNLGRHLQVFDDDAELRGEASKDLIDTVPFIFVEVA
jgi:hypothetical protein